MLFRGSRTLVWFLTVAVVLVLLTASVFTRGRDEKWAAMMTRLKELQAEARSRDVPRSVLRGKPKPGNAWDEYEIALDDALGWKEDPNGASLTDFIAGNANADRTKVNQMIAAHGAVLEHLRLGAQRADGQYPYKWENEGEVEVPNPRATRLFSSLAVAQARIWRESGRSQEAVDLLLDVSVFARDLSNNGPLLSSLMGNNAYSIAFDELRELILSRKLTRTQLADLEKKLEIVDHDFPALSSTLANETLSTNASAMKIAREDWWHFVKEDGWRYGFSPRRITLEAFEERESYMQRSQNIDQMDFATAKKEADAIATEANASPNPMIRLSSPDLPKVVVRFRDTLARLRLLRDGTSFLATGKVPTLADPFGSNLYAVDGVLKLKIWSVGSDGRDDGGQGGWSPKLSPPDIVLEISK